MQKKKPRAGKRVIIPAASIEFIEGGNTIWIHSPEGATVLRFKFTGGITTSELCKNSPVSHADAVVTTDLKICLSKDAIY